MLKKTDTLTSNRYWNRTYYRQACAGINPAEHETPCFSLSIRCAMVSKYQNADICVYIYKKVSTLTHLGTSLFFGSWRSPPRHSEIIPKDSCTSALGWDSLDRKAWRRRLTSEVPIDQTHVVLEKVAVARNKAERFYITLKGYISNLCFRFSGAALSNRNIWSYVHILHLRLKFVANSQNQWCFLKQIETMSAKLTAEFQHTKKVKRTLSCFLMFLAALSRALNLSESVEVTVIFEICLDHVQESDLFLHLGCVQFWQALQTPLPSSQDICTNAKVMHPCLEVLTFWGGEHVPTLHGKNDKGSLKMWQLRTAHGCPCFVKGRKLDPGTRIQCRYLSLQHRSLLRK